MENKKLENEKTKAKLVQLVKNKYDIQKLRISAGNRIVASFNIQMGQKPSSPQEEMSDDGKKLLSVVQKEYKRITDGYIEKGTTIKKTIRELEPDLEYIKDMTDYLLINTYMKLLEAEKNNIKTLVDIVHQHPLWDAFFKNVKGCGEETAALCIALFDPYKARHVSCFWKYAGLNPVVRIDENGNTYHEANSKKYTELREYVDREGNVKEKKGITYNPTLKTGLLGVTSGSILKACIRSEYETDDNGEFILDEKGNKIPTGYKIATGPYANMYCDYKMRQIQKHPDYSRSHIERMALRWMIRGFVKDLWIAWRELEGLPVTIPYEVEFLGRAPHKWPNLKKYKFPESGK